MSARARRAIACANRSSRSTHPPAHYPTCREARTGTSHACRTRTAQLALAAAAIRFRVAAMLPAATQASMHLGATNSQAGEALKRPEGGQEAAAPRRACASVALGSAEKRGLRKPQNRPLTPQKFSSPAERLPEPVDLEAAREPEASNLIRTGTACHGSVAAARL